MCIYQVKIIQNSKELNNICILHWKKLAYPSWQKRQRNCFLDESLLEMTRYSKVHLLWIMYKVTLILMMISFKENITNSLPSVTCWIWQNKTSFAHTYTHLATETNSNNVKSLIHRGQKKKTKPWDALKKTQGNKYLLIPQSIKHLLTISGFFFFKDIWFSYSCVYNTMPWLPKWQCFLVKRARYGCCFLLRYAVFT